MEYFYFCIIVWLLAGLIAGGITFAGLQSTYPSKAKDDLRDDLRFALGTVVLGFIGLFVACFMFNFRNTDADSEARVFRLN
jgi:uncharacterized membrane protein YeaQ/YmgE (transglycosylase-associated protein family)